jgi:hypothetical protein
MNAGAVVASPRLAATDERALRVWTARGRVTQCPRGLKRNTLLRRYRLLRIRFRGVATVRVQLQPNNAKFAVSPWPGALDRASPASECDERDRCNAGRVLADHRVRIARQIVALSAWLDAGPRRNAAYLRTRSGSSDLATPSSHSEARVTRLVPNTMASVEASTFVTFSTSTSRRTKTIQLSDLSLGETTRLT